MFNKLIKENRKQSVVGLEESCKEANDYPDWTPTLVHEALQVIGGAL